MFLIGLGSNLVDGRGRRPVETCLAALERMAVRGLAAVALSRWYETAPIPASDQPWFVNGVARIEGSLDPAAVLTLLHDIEADLGRVRSVRNAARTIDLDLLAAGDHVSERDHWPTLPHPRLGERAFVLRPLRDVAPAWRHPGNGRSIDDLLATLGDDQEIRVL